MITPIRTLSISLALMASALPALATAQEEDDTRDVHSTNVGDRVALERKAKTAAAAAQVRAGADSEITRRAKEAAQAAHSEAFKALMNDMSPGLMNALGVEGGADIESGSPIPPELRPAPILVVFVSSSMPLPTLRRYAADIEKTGGAMALRGGVGGLKEMGPTVDFIMNVLKVDASCEEPDCDMREVRVIIDPLLFDAAKVMRVPAVAVVDHDPFVSYCERETEAARDDPWLITYGDASLEGHIEELARRGEHRAGRLLASWKRSAK